MSVLDKVAAALTPPESESDRINARNQARSVAEPGDWLSAALDHHLQIEEAFERAASASPAERPQALKALQTVFNAHSVAEELVLYPAMTEESEKGSAMMAYEEQTMAKIQFARLEKIDPASQEWNDKLEHIKGAVLHHVYEEEGTWFPRLKQATLQADQQMLTHRFLEEFSRYSGQDVKPSDYQQGEGLGLPGTRGPNRESGMMHPAA